MVHSHQTLSNANYLIPRLRMQTIFLNSRCESCHPHNLLQILPPFHYLQSPHLKSIHSHSFTCDTCCMYWFHLLSNSQFRLRSFFTTHISRSLMLIDITNTTLLYITHCMTRNHRINDHLLLSTYTLGHLFLIIASIPYIWIQQSHKEVEGMQRCHA